MSSAYLGLGGGIYSPAADYSSSDSARDLDYYLAPSRSAPADEKLGWMREMIAEGEAFLKQESAYPSLQIATDIIAGQAITATPGAACQAFVNTIKRTTQEAIAIMSNIRPFWNIIPNSHKDEQWEHQAHVLNGYYSHLYANTSVPLKLKEVLDYAYVEGTGYMSPTYSPHYWDRFEGEIDLLSYGSTGVLPVQMYRKNLQSAYCLIIREIIPITHLADIFGRKAEDINAYSTLNTGSSSVLESAKSMFSRLLGLKATGDQKSGDVEVAYCYINDTTLNRTNHHIRMGEWKDGRPLNSWSYEVPPLGKLFHIGWNPDGSAQTKVADENDSRLYPHKRLMIAAKDRILYDGPSFFWHGRYPAIKFTVDEWAWTYLGYSLVVETLSLNQAHSDILRGLVDLVNTKLNPPIVGNQRLMSRKLLKAFNPRAWGKNKLWLDTTQGNPIQPAIDMKNLSLENFYPDFLEKLNGMVKFVFGLPDLQSLAKARQIPGEGSIEKLASISGDIITMREHMLNQCMTEYGNQTTSLIFQFADTRRRMQIMGVEGWTEEDFDYDPGNLIPAHLPFEPEMRDDKGMRLKDVYASSRAERARSHSRNFKFHTKAGSMLQMTTLQNKLMKLQLRKALGPLGMDVQTLIESFDIADWGDLESLIKKLKHPEQMKGNSISERGLMELYIMQEFGSDAQMRAQLKMMMMQAMVQGQGGEGGPDAGGGPGGDAGQPGRPNVDSAPPSLGVKGDMRSTVRTSK